MPERACGVEGCRSRWRGGNVSPACGLEAMVAKGVMSYAEGRLSDFAKANCEFLRAVVSRADTLSAAPCPPNVLVGPETDTSSSGVT